MLRTYPGVHRILPLGRRQGPPAQTSFNSHSQASSTFFRPLHMMCIYIWERRHIWKKESSHPPGPTGARAQI